MKKFILSFFLFFSCFANAQQIQSVTFFPANPTETDTVYLIVESMFTSGGCDMQYHQTSLGPSITVGVFHCIGIATFICYNTDTILLGVFPSGIYPVNVNLYYSGSGIPCNKFSFGDSLVTDLIVDVGTGITPGPSQKPVVTTQLGHILVNGATLNSTFELFDLTGRRLLEQSLIQIEERIAATNLSGIYLFRITRPDGRSSTGKIKL